MDIWELLSALATGGGTSVGFQALKGDWNRWLTITLAVATGFGSGYAVGGAEGGVAAASAALATHSAIFAGTSLGAALKLSLAPRILRVIAEVTKNLAEAFENKPK